MKTISTQYLYCCAQPSITPKRVFVSVCQNFFVASHSMLNEDPI